MVRGSIYESFSVNILLYSCSCMKKVIHLCLCYQMFRQLKLDLKEQKGNILKRFSRNQLSSFSLLINMDKFCKARIQVCSGQSDLAASRKDITPFCTANHNDLYLFILI